MPENIKLSRILNRYTEGGLHIIIFDELGAMCKQREINQLLTEVHFY